VIAGRDSDEMAGMSSVFWFGAQCFGLPKSGRVGNCVRLWGAIVSYINRNGGKGRGATNPRMFPVVSVREGAERPLRAGARSHTTAQPPVAECRSPPLASFDSKVLHEL